MSWPYFPCQRSWQKPKVLAEVHVVCPILERKAEVYVNSTLTSCRFLVVHPMADRSLAHLGPRHDLQGQLCQPDHQSGRHLARLPVFSEVAVSALEGL